MLVRAPQVAYFGPKCNSAYRKDKNLLQRGRVLELSPHFLRGQPWSPKGFLAQCWNQWWVGSRSCVICFSYCAWTVLWYCCIQWAVAPLTLSLLIERNGGVSKLSHLKSQLLMIEACSQLCKRYPFLFRHVNNSYSCQTHSASLCSHETENTSFQIAQHSDQFGALFCIRYFYFWRSELAFLQVVYFSKKVAIFPTKNGSPPHKVNLPPSGTIYHSWKLWPDGINKDSFETLAFIRGIK